MRLGIDVRMAGSSGIGTYISQLVPRLPGRLRGARFVLLGEPRTARRLLPGAETVPVHAPVYSLREQVALPRAASGRGLDLLWVPHYNAPVAGRTPLAVTIHDLIHVLFPTYLPRPRRLALLYANTLLRRVGHKARVVFAPSRHTRADVIRVLGVPARRIRVTPLAVDPGFRSPPARAIRAARRRHGGRYVLYVGNLKPHKNLERLVKAFAQLPDPGLRLVLAGTDGGRYAARLRGLAQEAGLERRVGFPGVLRRDELPALFAGAAVFAFPSLYEGFGLPPLEAMACGTPVVASTASSLPEVVGDAGLLVPPAATDRLAAALWAVLSSARLRKTLVARGRTRVKTFCWDRCADLTAAGLLAAARGA